MRYLTSTILVLLIIFLNYSCESKSLDAEVIVAKAYDAHGRKANWDKINVLNYQKESIVYDAEGAIRVKSLQEHRYNYRPKFNATIDWEEADQNHQIQFTDARALKYIDEELINDETVAESAYNSVNAARYTVSQPFKLSDKGVQLTYEGIDELEEGQQVHVVKASYNMENENHTDNDEWWYFFDVDTYLCMATMVHHGTTYSYIKNLKFDHSTNIVFNSHRKGYSVDSARNILYHQSEYFYRNYIID
jgi:hypothetical protein